MSATPEQIAEPHSFSPDEIAQRIEHFGASFDLDVMKQAAALIRALSERVRLFEGGLKKITPLVSQLNQAAEINTEWGRVVVGQAQAARDLFAVVAALNATGAA